MLYTEKNEEEIEDIEEEKSENKLISIDELIKEGTKTIISELNKYAREAFKEGRLSFKYYIPQIMWETQEVIGEITRCMKEAGWSFGEVSTWKQGDIRKKEIVFNICEVEESKGI